MAKSQAAQEREAQRNFATSLIYMSVDERISKSKEIRADIARIFRFDKAPLLRDAQESYVESQYDELIGYLWLLNERKRPDREPKKDGAALRPLMKIEFMPQNWSKKSNKVKIELSFPDAMKKLDYHLHGVAKILEYDAVRDMLSRYLEQHMMEDRGHLRGKDRIQDAEIAFERVARLSEDVATLQNVLHRKLLKTKQGKTTDLTLQNIVKGIGTFWTGNLGGKYTITGEANQPESPALCFIYCTYCYAFPHSSEAELRAITQQAFNLKRKCKK